MFFDRSDRLLLQQMSKKLDQLVAQGAKTLAEIDDLKAAVAAEQAVITEVATDIDAVIAKLGTPGILPADVAAAASAITDATTALKASATKLEAAITPPTP